MTAQTLERPTAATPPVPVHCAREECGKPMLYRYQQTPGDGTVPRSAGGLCERCRGLSRKLVPFEPGRSPFQRRGLAHLETIPELLDRGMNADQIASDLGYSSRKEAYRFLRRHDQQDLLGRLKATVTRCGDMQ